jgi:hypothetical protein
VERQLVELGYRVMATENAEEEWLHWSVETFRLDLLGRGDAREDEWHQIRGGGNQALSENSHPAYVGLPRSCFEQFR